MSRRRGNTNENAFMELAEAEGYCTFAARGSRGPIDVLAFEGIEWDGVEGDPMPPLVVQVGTKGKPIAATLRELHEAPRPIGSLPIVARKLKQKNRRIKWKFSTQAGSFDTLADAIRGERA